MLNFQYSEEGYALTKEFEGLRLKTYRDQGGVLTIGYGHTGSDVHDGDTVTEEEACNLLTRDTASSVACVNRLVRAPINQNQFDALVDFVFNLGCGSLEISKLLLCVNAEEYILATPEFMRWIHVGGEVNDGLIRRRKAEALLFAKGIQS